MIRYGILIQVKSIDRDDRIAKIDFLVIVNGWRQAAAETADLLNSIDRELFDSRMPYPVFTISMKRELPVSGRRSYSPFAQFFHVFADSLDPDMLCLVAADVDLRLLLLVEKQQLP